jgi:L-alanine-DL-glutamate epimerase-like enolase superfamily enzyme
MADLAAAYDSPLATGENLFPHQDARNLLRYGGLRSDRDVLQFDCALSYGLVEYLRTLEVLREHGWSWRQVVPHGGHQMSLNLAAGLGLGGNESYPGVFQPFGGFADDLPIENSYVRLPDAPGIGFERKQALFDLLRSVAE